MALACALAANGRDSLAQSPGRVGPSFDCSAESATRQTLARTICEHEGLAAAESRYVMTYYAVRHSIPEKDRATLSTEADAFTKRIARTCEVAGESLPPAGRDQAILCLQMQFEAERMSLMNRLSPDGRAELDLALTDAVRIQQLLMAASLLPSNSTVDGKFGPVTRKGIADWQRLSGLPVSGFASRDMLEKLKAGQGDKVVGQLSESGPKGPPDTGGVGVNGWQQATWGMSRVEVERAYPSAKRQDLGGCNTEVWSDSPGVCPLLESKAYEMLGTTWDIEFRFKYDRLVRVRLRAKSENSPEMLYDSVKQALQSKYGLGKEETFNDNSRCDNALARWNAGRDVVRYEWYSRDEGRHYYIRTRLGVVRAALTEAPVCLSVPGRVGIVAGGPRRVSIEYIKNEQVDPSKL